MRTPDSEKTEKTEETWKYSFHLGLFISETKYLQKYSKCNSLTIRITLLFSTKELYSQLSLGPVFLFWSVAYTQLFLKLFKFHLEPFKYRHSVNAQPELSFLLRIPLYCCRWICRSELLPVFPWMQFSPEPYGLEVGKQSCQFFRESHFPALLGYRQQVFYISPPWLASTVSCNGNIEKIRLCDSGYQIGRRCNIWSFLYHNCFLDNKMPLSFRLYG